ncbi:metallopeptidase family protein [uncultured Pseudokineococcus sp.]|uniref:metallopeptidase family protein n=1 Tax=uncultured Pseudokineococcus sp. TaxID=1642928 RepID=UPI002623131E|nr:metallopeptidase family protein [uncultured Pseudokineococcus sp.]
MPEDQAPHAAHERADAAPTAGAPGTSAGPSPATATSPGRRPARRRRDRRGRGLRGPLLPAALPASRTRSERFDDLVLDAVEDVEQVLDAPLQEIEFAVEDVPPAPTGADDDAVPLGRFSAADRGRPARVVVYRRPVETRASEAGDLEDLVHHVVVEQIAHALGTEPERLDPHYRDD